jgi:hypothetical protein
MESTKNILVAENEPTHEQLNQLMANDAFAQVLVCKKRSWCRLV